MTRAEFIDAVETLYGDKYDCSGVTEHNLTYETTFPVRCQKHGTFYTTPYQLLHGLIGGCFECYKEETWGREKKREL